MDFDKVFKEGYEAFKPDLSVYESTPYKREEVRDGKQVAYQIEAIPFFNGWEQARKEHDKAEGYSLFLDDYRFPNWVNWVQFPPSHWIIARHYYDFVEIINKHGLPKFVTFDHDLDLHGLNMGELPYKTGVDCAQWLIDYCEANSLLFPNCAIHSTNQICGPRIYNLILKYLKEKGIYASN